MYKDQKKINKIGFIHRLNDRKKIQGNLQTIKSKKRAYQGCYI